MAGGPGFEPGPGDPESPRLPLADPPETVCIISHCPSVCKRSPYLELAPANLSIPIDAPKVKGNFNVLIQRVHDGRIYPYCSRIYFVESSAKIALLT